MGCRALRGAQQDRRADRPAATPEQVAEQIERQRETATLGVPDRACSRCRRAGAGRARGNKTDALAQSRLPALETALGGELMPQQRAPCGARGDRRRAADRRCTWRAASTTTAASSPSRRSSCAACAARRRQAAMMLQRVDAETAEFEACTTASCAGDARGAQPHAQGRDGRPLSDRCATGGVGDAAADVGIAAEPRRQEGLRRAVPAPARPARRRPEELARDPPHARRLVQPAQRRVRLRPRAQPCRPPTSTASPPSST